MLTPLAMGRKSGGGDTSLLLKTGQTTQYGGYEDDGDIQAGVAKSYTINTTGDQSGTTNITLNGKTDVHSNNTVTDDNTTLEWSRYAAASVGPSSNGTLPWTTNGDGEGIFAYATAANAASLAGYNDWRVPNRNELISLIELEAPNALPDVTAFPGFSTLNAWTASTRPNSTSFTFYIRFSDGSISYSTKITNFLIILVRGGV